MPLKPYDSLLMTIVKSFSEGWHVHDADISTPFNKEIIDGEVYRLIKSLYQQKKSSRLWFEKLSGVLK